MGQSLLGCGGGLSNNRSFIASKCLVLAADTPQFSGRGSSTSHSAPAAAADVVTVSSEQIELEVTGVTSSMFGVTTTRGGLDDLPSAKRGSTTASTTDSGMGTLGSNDSQQDGQVEHVVRTTPPLKQPPHNSSS